MLWFATVKASRHTISNQNWKKKAGQIHMTDSHPLHTNSQIFFKQVDILVVKFFVF